MSHSVGIDYGSGFLKAAAAASVGDAPRLLTLEPDSPCLPAAVSVDTQGVPLAVGQAAFARRRSVEQPVAWEFRDRVVDPRGKLVVGGQTLSGLRVQATLWQHVWESLRRAAPDLGRIAVAVPDHWPATRWSLPPALRAAGFPPCLLVRESLAVLAAQRRPLAERVVLLSLGRGAARGALCERTQGVWRRRASAAEESLTGRRLRDRLLAQFAERVIQGTRRDPREDSVADQAIHDAVESTLRALATAPTARLVLQTPGLSFSETLDRPQLTQVAEGFGELARQLRDRICQEAGVEPGACDTVVWGELSQWLPVVDWLATGPRASTVSVAPLDVVAAGAALVARLDEAGGLRPPAWPSPLIGVEDGAFRADGAEGGDHWPCLESLPATGATSAAGAARPPRLTLLDESSGATREIRETRYVLGRQADAHWQFQYERHPMVSGRHAAIVRQGDEYVLEDLGSANGTFLNDAELRTPRTLRSGDTIGLGRQGPRLRFERE